MSKRCIKICANIKYSKVSSLYSFNTMFVFLFIFKFFPIFTSFYESFRAPVYLGHGFVGLNNFIDLLLIAFFGNHLKFPSLIQTISNNYIFFLALLVTEKLKEYGFSEAFIFYQLRFL